MNKPDVAKSSPESMSTGDGATSPDLFRVQDGHIVCNQCNFANPLKYGSAHYTDCPMAKPSLSPEMEQLVDALKKLANEVSGWLELEPIRLAGVMGYTNVAVLRERLTIARDLLDHIEGKGK